MNWGVGVNRSRSSCRLELTIHAMGPRMYTSSKSPNAAPRRCLPRWAETSLVIDLTPRSEDSDKQQREQAGQGRDDESQYGPFAQIQEAEGFGVGKPRQQRRGSRGTAAGHDVTEVKGHQPFGREEQHDEKQRRPQERQDDMAQPGPEAATVDGHGFVKLVGDELQRGEAHD